ncbi:WD40-repeat-containing domain protein [Pavlovales sp. CCMP2436]|nr:WD40-repeat-containing domain protein [Pavlovales sp. CCMP2436]
MAGSQGLLYVGFNQDHGCFACGTDSGFRIYNCDPFKQTFRRVVVVLEYKVYVYNFADLRLMHHFETISNPKGLCALSPSSSACVLACPGLQKGHLRVELFDIRRPTLIAAHEGTLSCLALNLDGTRLATASERGTLIRVWDSHSGQPLHELRRGAEAADIQSIAFNFDSTWLAVSSDHGTVHVFSLVSGGPAGNGGGRLDRLAGNGKPPEEAVGEVAENTKSSLSFLSSLLPTSIMPKYISSQWSVAQFHTPGHQAVHSSVRTICAFGSERNTLIVISSDGSFYKCSFDPQRGGEARREKFARFLQIDDEDAR